MKMSLQNQKGLVTEAVTGRSGLASVPIPHIKNSFLNLQARNWVGLNNKAKKGEYTYGFKKSDERDG